MTYAEYKHHQNTALYEDGCCCDCPSCTAYERNYHDEIVRNQLNEALFKSMLNDSES